MSSTDPIRIATSSNIALESLRHEVLLKTGMKVSKKQLVEFSVEHINECKAAKSTILDWLKNKRG